MPNGERLSLEQIRTFLAASEEFRFEANSREEVYGWVTRTLVEQEYGRQKREAKGLLRRYVAKMTQRRRSQTEARIAIFKNGFLGSPLLSKGYGNQQREVAWSVLAHNLWVIAWLPRAAAPKLAQAS
jgi:hypothetical protein